MTDYLDQVFDQAAGGEPATAVAAKVRPKGDYLDEMFGDDDATRADVENADFLTDLVTGAGRNTPEIAGLPEISAADIAGTAGQSFGERMRTTGGGAPSKRGPAQIEMVWAAQPDQSARARMIKEYRPDAEISFDTKRNIVVDLDGKKFVLNAPGVSGADMADLASETVLAMPAARATRAVGALGKRMMATGAGEAMTMAQRQQLSPYAETDLAQVLGSAIGGAGGEVVGSVIVGALRKAGAGAAKFFTADGAATPTGDAFFKRLGIDVSIITPDVGQQIATYVSRLGKDATEAFARRTDGEATDAIAGAARQGQASEFGIPLTRGQATGDVAQQRTEDTLRRGARGAPAARIMGAFDDQQRQALSDAGGQVAEGMGIRAGQNRQDSARAVAEQLSEEHRALQAKVDDAYDTFKDVDAHVDDIAVNRGKLGLVAALREEGIVVDQAMYPESLKALKVYDRMVGRGGRGEGAKFKGKSLQQIEQFRKYLNKRINATASAPTGDSAALTRMKRALDDELDQALDDGLITGDPGALQTILNARRLRTELGRKFGVASGKAGRHDSAGKFLEGFIASGKTDNEFANWLYGSSRIGEGARAVGAVKRLKEGFGVDSEIFENVRAGALWHSLYGPRSSMAGDGTISPDVMYTNLTNALSPESKQYMEVLFSPDEMRTLRRLQVAVHRARNNRLAMNHSGTGASVEQSIGRMMQVFSRTMAAGVSAATGDVAPIIAQVTLSQAGKQARTAASARGAKQATSTIRLPYPPAKPLLPALGTAAITGVGAGAIDAAER